MHGHVIQAVLTLPYHHNKNATAVNNLVSLNLSLDLIYTKFQLSLIKCQV